MIEKEIQLTSNKKGNQLTNRKTDLPAREVISCHHSGHHLTFQGERKRTLNFLTGKL